MLTIVLRVTPINWQADVAHYQQELYGAHQVHGRRLNRADAIVVVRLPAATQAFVDGAVHVERPRSLETNSTFNGDKI